MEGQSKIPRRTSFDAYHLFKRERERERETEKVFVRRETNHFESR